LMPNDYSIDIDSLYGSGAAEAQQATQIRANGQAASGTSPDTFAQQVRVAQGLGLPTTAVTAAPAVPQRQIVGQTIDQNTQGAPVARQAYTSPDFASLAHDQSHPVGLWDRFQQMASTAVGSSPILSTLVAGPGAAVNAVSGLFGYKPGDITNSAMGGGMAGIASATRGVGAIGDVQQRMANRTLGNSPLAQMAQHVIGGLIPGSFLPGSQGVASTAAPLDDEARLLESQVQQHGRLAAAARMVGGIVPYVIAGEVAPLVMAAQGADSQAQEATAHGQAGTMSADLGTMANAVWQGTLGHYIGAAGDVAAGLVPDLAEKFGLGTLDSIPQTVAAQLATNGGRLAARGASAGAIGGAMQLGSNVISKETVNPAQDLAEGVTDNAGQMALFDLAAHGLHAGAAALGDRFVRAANGEADGNVADGMNLIAEASKLRTRAPDVWQNYLQQVTEEHGAPDSVYISPEAFHQTFSTPEGQVALSHMPESVQDAVSVASRTGGDVKMPVSEFGTYVAGTPLYQGVADHLKFDPNSVTRSESGDMASSESPRVLAEISQAMQQKGATDEFAASRDRVEQTIKGQLDQAGRASPEVNALNAKLGAHSIAVHAARAGMTPEDFHAEHGFTVKGGDQSSSGGSLDQPNHVATLTGDEIAPHDAPIADLRAAAKKWFAENLSGKSVRSNALDADVEFASPRKPLSASADPRKLKLFAAIPDLIEHGAKVDSQADIKGTRQVKAWHYLRGVVDLEGKPTSVTLSVREDGNGHFYYNHVVEDAAPQRTDPASKAGGGSEGSAYDQPLEENGDNINMRFESAGETGKPRGNFVPETNTINLLKDANLSTFIHETGHFHLETLSKFAGTNEDSAKDLDAVLHWFDPDLTRDQWNAMRLDERRPMHEQFAQGFEKYLFEGNSPTRALNGVFQRMSAWLKNIYRSLAGLNVELTPEVRAVMDRLVATPDEIRGAERDMNYRPAFDAKPEFMTDDQWGAYQSLGLQATMDAVEKLGTRTVRDLQWMEGAKSRELKRLQGENATLRKGVREEVAQQVNAEPVNRARMFLKRGMVDGEVVTGPHKLSIDAVAKVLGIDKRTGVQPTFLGFEVKGPSLLEWISRRGGIWDGEGKDGEFKGGDLKAIGADKWHTQKPFRKKLLRDPSQGHGDRGPDNVLHDAIESGYFPELSGADQSNYSDAHDVSILHDAINKELAGRPRYADVGEVNAHGLSADDEARIPTYAAWIEDTAEKSFGIAKGSLDPDFLNYAAKLKLEGMPEDEAFMRAVNEYAAAVRHEIFAETEGKGYGPVPYDWRSDNPESGREGGDDAQGSDRPGAVGDDAQASSDGAVIAGKNAAEVKAALGYGKYGILGREKAIDPEMVAEQFGYNSAREMISDLVTAPKAQDKIRDTTDQRMLERYGDVSDPRRMAEAAMEAIHNDARGRLLATEYRALEKALGRKYDLTQAAKDFAAKAVGDMKLSDLKPDRFRAEERRAGEKADRAIRENDLETAAAMKRAQMLNFHIAQAVDQARDRMEKQVDYLKGFNRKARRQRVGTDIELIDALLSDFDLRNNPNDNPSIRQVALRDWFKSAVESGFEPLVDERLLVPKPKTPYTSLSVDEMTGLHDTVKSVAHVAMEKNTIRIEGRKLTVEKAVSDLMAPLTLRGNKFTPEELVEPPQWRTDGILPTALHRFQSFLMSAFHGSLKGQDFKSNRYDMHEIDGPFSRYIFGRLTDRNYWKVDKTSEISSAFIDKAQELGRDWQDGLLDTVQNDELLDPKTGQPLKMTRGRMLRMATHVGNESNFRKMVQGWGWESEPVWGFLRRNMTAKDWDAAQFIWDQFEPLWDESEAMARRLGGVIPEKIDPRPFEVETPDGQRVSLRGGYSPIDYDPLRSKLADRRGALDVDRRQAINPLDGVYRATTTGNGSMKNRVEGYTDVVSLEFNGIGRNLRDTVHDLAYREALIDIDKVMNNSGFRDQFMQSYGREEYVAMRQMLANIRDLNARDDGMNEFERIMTWTRQGAVITGIGYRLSTVVKHGTSAALKSLGYSSGGGQKYFLARVARLATGNWANDFAEAQGKFPEIRARLLQMDRDYKATNDALLERETALQKNERYGHMLIAYSDALSAVATAHAAYDWAVTEGIPAKLGGTGQPMTHDKAVSYADKTVREAHGSALETVRSNFLHDRGAKSLLGQLYGFQNNTLGQIMDAADKAKTGGLSMQVLSRLTATLLMPAVAAQWVAHGGPDGAEPWYSWMGEAITGELASTVPLVRECWRAIESQIHYGKVDFGQLPVFQVAGNAINIPIDGWKEMHGQETKIIQHTFDMLGQLGHIAGAGQAGHMIQYQRDVNSGKANPTGPGDYSKHMLVGGS
jgi:hypothetical protein